MRIRTTAAGILAAAMLVSLPTQAQETAPSQNVPQEAPRPNRPKIGLALGGGGALGLAEIGVIRWMEENHIPIDGIAGASMGALVGGLYASGKTTEEIQQLTSDKVFGRVFRLSADFQSLSYRRREDRRNTPNYITVGLRHGVSFRNGLLVDSGLNGFLSAQFMSYGDQTRYDQLPIPFRCTATDITEGKAVVFSQGALPESIRASISLPGIYPPLEKDGHIYVDGGVLENLPTQTLKSDLKDDVIIAVSLPLSKLAKGEDSGLLGTLQRSFSVAIWGNELQSRRLADVVIEPQTGDLSTLDYGKTAELVKLGYAAAEAQRQKLLVYRLSDDAWQAYLEERNQRRADKPRNIAAIKVKARDQRTERGVEHNLQTLVGQPADAAVIDEKLDEVRADERYSATYSVSYPKGPIKGVRDAAVTVTLHDKENGPPFLLVGGNIQAQTGQTPRFTLDLTYLHQDLGNYGSELRGSARVGFMEQFGVEYYRRLTADGFFIAPHADLIRRPYYLYSRQRRTSERLYQNGGGGVDMGYTFGHARELRAGWQIFSQRWALKTGTDSQPDYSQSGQLADVRFVYDGQDRAEVSQRGFRWNATAGYLYGAAGSANAPRATGRVNYSITMRKNTLLLTGEGGTFFNHNVAQPFRFTLGGPGRLTASAFEEYRGTDYFLTRAAYLRTIATLPQPLGQHVYLALAYEAGQMRAPLAGGGVIGTDYTNPSGSFLRQNFMFGILAETPLGVISFGPAFGDAGRRKLSFTLGRAF